MYEFVALAIPMKHVHAPGKCNKAMTSKLSKHMRTTPDDDMAEDTFAPEEEVELMNEEETQVDLNGHVNLRLNSLIQRYGMRLNLLVKW